MPLAHSANALGQEQDLEDHLRNVAEMAGKFAAPWGAIALATVAGWLHDIGKLDPAFQQYLLMNRSAPGTPKRGPDHKGAGALLAAQARLDPLCFLIQGHHGGLRAQRDVKVWLAERQKEAAPSEAISIALKHFPHLDSLLRATAALPPPIVDHHDMSSLDLYLRMLFSALVDADFLDTERHFQPSRHLSRVVAPSVTELWHAFTTNQAQLSGQRNDKVNQIRHRVYVDSLAHATEPAGFFRLTGPTGIGKTRLSLGFALRHAQEHGLQRIIYAIPYTSITEQTASEFRRIFATHPHVVLEHHSAVHGHDPEGTPTQEETWARLAAENWDAPIVVTTTVQLFESLHAASTSSCRKLHNLACSVIVLDEAQMLPTHVLAPILDTLKQLVTRYGASVIFCTATQPALDESLGRYGLTDVREIVPDPAALFAELKRVEYSLPARDERWSWERIANTMTERSQALAIVNTRAHAVGLLAALRAQVGEQNADSIFHLSTWMCGAHRQATLAAVRHKLQAGEACWLISTQVVEAGVDLDFPKVLRALAPLDRIVQAAGRCNRNGRLDELGQVIVFVPEDGGLPRGAYSIGVAETLTFLQDGAPDLHDPEVYSQYFRSFYARLDLDARHVQDARHVRRLDFPEVERAFRMIEEETIPVVITTRDVPALANNPANELLEQLRHAQGTARGILRQLQPYIVGLRSQQISHALQRHLAEEVIPGLYQWHGDYDQTSGILLDSVADARTLVQ